MSENSSHVFEQLIEVQKQTGTLYCGGFDIHPFAGGWKENMAVYGFRKRGKIDHASPAFGHYERFAALCGVPMRDIARMAGLMTAIEEYLFLVMDILVGRCNVRVFKPQFGLYVQFGPIGLVLLQRLKQHMCKLERSHGITIIDILDCKPGDIDTTQAGYLRGFMGNLQEEWGIDYAPFDFSVINPTPWMGKDVLVLEDKVGNPLLGKKFLERGKGLIYVCRTSNPSGPEYQDLLTVGNLPLYKINARNAYQTSLQHRLEPNGVSQLGLVVGATYPSDGSIRQLFPTCTMLHPGFGAQSLDAKDPLAPFKKVMLELRRDERYNGLGAIFSSSRNNLFPWMVKYGGSGKVENLEEDLVVAVARHRALEEEMYQLPVLVDVGISNPFK
jgi:orotidine-5'-phosphate decarboxylase